MHNATYAPSGSEMKISVRDIKRGMILPYKSPDAVSTVIMRDDIQNVTVLHVGGYTWHGHYSEAVMVMMDE